MTPRKAPAMKVSYIVSSIDAEAAGPSYSVPRLACAVGESGADVELNSLGVQGVDASKGFPHHRFPQTRFAWRMLDKLGHSPSLRRHLNCAPADIFHTHGLWMLPGVYAVRAGQKNGKPVVLSPRGMLGRDALRFSRGAKLVFDGLWQRRALAAVSCFHATAKSEYDDIRDYGLKQPVAIIPNGIDVPSNADLSGMSEGIDELPPFVLSLGRIHPKKALDRLVAAFSIARQNHPEWQLRIVGPAEGDYADALRRQINNLGLAGNVHIEDAVFGRQKFCLMRNASIFALPTLHENFGMTVAESLAVGTPVISTKGAPWAGLETYRCGWWIDHGPDAMATALSEAMSMRASDRRAMGARGRSWMERDFDWRSIGKRMCDVYEWSLGLRHKPEFVFDEHGSGSISR